MAMAPTRVHFNGSVNLPDAETVMREISSRIPVGVSRMTDGETGDRGYWILFQIRKFQQMPEFEPVTVGRAYETAADAPQSPQLRLAEGASADTIEWPNLGYADAYAESFEVFDRLQREGTIPAGVLFQVQYPTPLASMAGTIVRDDQPAVAASYEKALFADLDTLLDRLPHDRCAVQWDVAVEFGLLEGAGGAGPATPIDQITPALVRCVDRVPADVPVDAVVAAAHRPVSWASFTVPQARRDAGYFAPLRDLTAGPETELYFALVPYHPDDQSDGTTADQVRHIDGALGLSAAGQRDWGVCTECGMGRVERSDVPKLLDLHSEILGL
jgi:hypothetical protein